MLRCAGPKGLLTGRDERPLQIQNIPALETTIEGKLNGEPTRIRAVVVKKQSCVYDLM